MKKKPNKSKLAGLIVTYAMIFLVLGSQYSRASTIPLRIGIIICICISAAGLTLSLTDLFAEGINNSVTFIAQGVLKPKAPATSLDRQEYILLAGLAQKAKLEADSMNKIQQRDTMAAIESKLNCAILKNIREGQG